MFIKKISYSIIGITIASFCCLANAANNVVNLYLWAGYIPPSVIQQFERESGIKVNLSTYENNEVMYAKLKATPAAGYDLILPSSNYVDRLRKEGMLVKLDKSLIPNFSNIIPSLLHTPQDPDSAYSAPFAWGTTGIFYNVKDYSGDHIKRWADLWDDQFENKLMLLDDARDVFACALFILGYPVNDTNPAHIREAYLKLKKLMPNVKVFSSDMVNSILIDEDATVGMAWNGDVYKASEENPSIHYVYPAEGFVIWVDSFAIPKGAPHQAEAHAFINFINRPEIAERITLYTGFPTANLAGKLRLPAKIRDNAVAYPDKETLKRGQYITNTGDATLALIEKYWELLKMGG